LGILWLKSENDYPTPSTNEVKWHFTSTFPHIFMSWCFVHIRCSTVVLNLHHVTTHYIQIRYYYEVAVVYSYVCLCAQITFTLVSLLHYASHLCNFLSYALQFTETLYMIHSSNYKERHTNRALRLRLKMAIIRNTVWNKYKGTRQLI